MRIRKQKKTAIYLLLALGLLAVLVYCFGRNVEPVLRSMAVSQSRIICTRVVNEAILEVISDEQFAYESIVNITYDGVGRVTSLSADTLLINRLDSLLTLSINEALETISTTDITVPLGTLLGWEFLSGRGPRVTLKMIPSPFVESRITSDFVSSGINQTRHTICVEYTVSLSAIISPYTFSVSVPSNLCIAETLIVGAVPEMFADFDI